MPVPENVSSLQSLANYYKVFVLNMYCLRASLNKVLKKLKMGLEDGVPSIRKKLKEC